MEPHLNTITLVVDNLEVSLDFYRALGLNIPYTVGNEYYVECVSPHATPIVFITKQNMLKLNPKWKGGALGRLGLHFKFSSLYQLEQCYAALMDLGYISVTVPYDTKWGERYAEVSDPDGNVVSLFAHLTLSKRGFSLTALSVN